MDPDPDWIRIRIGIQPKMLDPDPDEMNADPQPWRAARQLSGLTSTSYEDRLLELGLHSQAGYEHGPQNPSAQRWPEAKDKDSDGRRQ